MRAVGAFLVEARYRAKEQTVDAVRIFSERGKTCVLQNPFAGECIRVIRADTRETVATEQNEETFTFQTAAAVTYEIAPSECMKAPAGVPIVTLQPASVTVVLPGPATFTVTATGNDLRYQWQKNRVDIPGATSPTYTTPATTLWDIGSGYRCLVSNSIGTTRSHPGILNPHNESPREGRI